MWTVLRQKRHDGLSPMCWRGKMVKSGSWRGKGTRSCRVSDMITFVRLKGQVLATPLWSTDPSSQKPGTQNLYHSDARSPYYITSFLSFKKLKNTFINYLSDSRVLFYCPFYSEFNWYLVGNKLFHEKVKALMNNTALFTLKSNFTRTKKETIFDMVLFASCKI